MKKVVVSIIAIMACASIASAGSSKINKINENRTRCVLKQVALLDDGVTDAKTVSEAVAQACLIYLQAMVNHSNIDPSFLKRAEFEKVLKAAFVKQIIPYVLKHRVQAKNRV